MVTYQFEVDDETWNAWKQTVPRDKSLEVRIVELLEADTEGRVADATESREATTKQSGGEADRGPTAEAQAAAGGEEPPAHPRDSGGETQVEWVSYQLQKAGVEFPQGRDRTECELAVSGAFAYLANDREATKGQIVLATMAEQPLGYDVEAAREKVEAEGERFRGAWWRRVVKPGLENLPGVEKPSGGRSEWRYTGR